MVWTGDSRGRLAPSLIALIDQADTRWPRRSRISDGSLGDPSHASRGSASDHNPKSPNPPGWVDAVDITRDHIRGPDLDRFWNHLISRRDPRVKYAIYKARIVKSYVDSTGHAAWVAQPYNGVNAHESHMHVSVKPEGRTDTSLWFPPEAPTQPEDDDVKPTIYWLRAKDGNHAHIVSGFSAHYLGPAQLKTWQTWGAPEVKDPVDPSVFHVLDGPLKTP